MAVSTIQHKPRAEACEVRCVCTQHGPLCVCVCVCVCGRSCGVVARYMPGRRMQHLPACCLVCSRMVICSVYGCVCCAYYLVLHVDVRASIHQYAKASLVTIPSSPHGCRVAVLHDTRCARVCVWCVRIQAVCIHGECMCIHMQFVCICVGNADACGYAVRV